MSTEGDPFRSFHAHRRWSGLARSVAVVAGVLVAGSAVAGLASAAPPPATTVLVRVVAEAEPLPAPTDAGPQQVPEPAASPLPRPGEWDIEIDTTGYQPELDQCLWVRMDLGAVAPIVGAHNRCGGAIVLEMLEGDLVTLHGASLDGRYEVVEARDARAGDSAAEATAGITADVVLQTCYWRNDGSERLVALVRVQ